MYKTSCCLTRERVIAAEKLELQSHHQLQDVLDVGVAPETHVHSAFGHVTKSSSAVEMHVWTCVCVNNPMSSWSCADDGFVSLN